jgi:hypothetical protein
MIENAYPAPNCPCHCAVNFLSKYRQRAACYLKHITGVVHQDRKERQHTVYSMQQQIQGNLKGDDFIFRNIDTFLSVRLPVTKLEDDIMPWTWISALSLSEDEDQSGILLLFLHALHMPRRFHGYGYVCGSRTRSKRVQI